MSRFIDWYAECRYAECHYAECRIALISGISWCVLSTLVDFKKRTKRKSFESEHSVPSSVVFTDDTSLFQPLIYLIKVFGANLLTLFSKLDHFINANNDCFSAVKRSSLQTKVSKFTAKKFHMWSTQNYFRVNLLTLFGKLDHLINISNIYGIFMKRSCLQNRVSKFTSKKVSWDLPQAC